MMIGGFTLVTVAEIEAKVKEVKDAMTYKYKEEDIDRVGCSDYHCHQCFYVF